MKKPKIIVIGAGYAGISFLKNLNRDCFKLGDFSIINKNTYHYHSTMLHKIATAEKSGKIMFDLREILDPEIKIIQERVISIEKDQNKIITNSQFSDVNKEYEYDYLVCAAGFEKETFDIEGINNAMFIDSYVQSARICEEIKNKFNEAVEKNTEMTISVCGGGLTGVEFAASAINMLKQKCKFHGLDANKFHVQLISSTPRLLTMFSENLSKKTADRLEKMGVEIHHNTRIKSIGKNRLNYTNGESSYSDIIIWTAGVKGSSLVVEGNVCNIRGRVNVDDKLKAEGSKNLFYIGDVSAVYPKDSTTPYPPTAQIALEQGKFLAQEFEAILKNEKFDKKFTFKSDGTICSIGHNYATAEVFGFDMSGYLPSILKTLVEKKWNIKLLGPKGLLV